MGKQIAARMMVNLSNEQYQAFLKAAQILGDDDLNDAEKLRAAIELYCDNANVVWPLEPLEWGGKRAGGGWPKGRKRKPTPSNEGVGK